MEIKNLITRFWPTGSLVLTGFILIIYIALGFLYLQQGVQQRELERQIVKLGAIVDKPLPSVEELLAEYEECNFALAPMPDSDAIARLVSIAEENGIDIEEDSGKFRVPSATFSQAPVGGGSYQLLSFRDIYVQGDYDSVMAFIADLGSDKTLKTMVLTRVDISQIEVRFEGEEGDRRAEFRNVASAVEKMMSDIDLLEIPNPMSFAGGVAVNLMGDDPDTEETIEGFPDITATAADKGADATFMTAAGATEVLGYLLYGHQLIVDVDGDGVYEAGDGDAVKSVNYVTMSRTTYYYTCEADGTVRQFDGADVSTAMEYLSSEESKMETVAIVSVDIYTKPEE